MNLIDVEKQYELYKEEIDSAIKNVVENAKFIMGPEVLLFENELSRFLGVKHSIACASGTDALLLALMAYGVKAGDEIITTPFSFIAAAEVIAFLKAVPIFVDVDPRTYNIDPSKIVEVVTGKTRGIIAVDIFGQCADYDAIQAIAQQYNLFVIEDGAQSLGAEYKGRKACSLGHISCTSFFPAKPLGCFGDGGAVFTDDDSLAERMKSVRLHGKGTHKYDHAYIGMNSRLDTIQAAVLLVKLKHFAKEIEERQNVAAYYSERLSSCCVTPYIEEYNRSVFAQYVIQTEHRDKLQNDLKERQIPTAVYYPKPLHLQTALKSYGYQQGDFLISEKLCDRVLALPMHPFLTRDDQDAVIGAVQEFFKNAAKS